VVQRLLEAERFAPESILATRAAIAALEDVLQRAGREFPVYECSQQDLNSITGIEFHRGCLALARRPEDLPLASFTASRILLALEGIGNPDNVGGIFRNALAFGAGGVLLDPRCADPLYRKAVRTSMGAVLRVPFQSLYDWPATLTWFRGQGFRIVALTPSREAEPLGAFAASNRAAKLLLLFGSEGEGLSAGALALSDAHVRIRIDPRADSLNVAVAAGIALHALGAGEGSG
jgi:tRNA G18 (ribose-2'-O)-methylase SpoU